MAVREVELVGRQRARAVRVDHDRVDAARRASRSRTRPRSSAPRRPPCRGSRTRTRSRRAPRRARGGGRRRSSRRRRRRASCPRRAPRPARPRAAARARRRRRRARAGSSRARSSRPRGPASRAHASSSSSSSSVPGRAKKRAGPPVPSVVWRESTTCSSIAAVRVIAGRSYQRCAPRLARWPRPRSSSRVPEAEALIGEYRREHTEEGRHGMAAHVTLLYPVHGHGAAGRAADERERPTWSRRARRSTSRSRRSAAFPRTRASSACGRSRTRRSGS